MSIQEKSRLAKAIAGELGIQILSFEYEILLNLFERESCSAGKLLSLSSASSTSFFERLQMLLDGGLIASEDDETDRRKVVYSLLPHTREIMRSEFAKVGTVVHLATRDPSADHTIQDFIQNTIRLLNIRFFTCEFHILLVLYEHGSATSGAICNATGRSTTTCYSAMRKLQRRGLLHTATAQRDRRQKIYSLPESVRREMDRTHLGMAEWIAQHVAG